MFRIKICGVTSPDDARRAAEAGADAIGVNFCAQSPRFLTPSAALAVIEALPAGVAKVGVFVNAPTEDILDACERLRLDYIQLHGDESPEMLAHLKPWPIVRAFRLTESGWSPIVDYMAACQALDCLPAALLIDAHRPGLYGGTGQVVDWRAVGQRPEAFAGLPIILAGGLNPDNVSQAIETAAPWGIDTASGVESSPGIKDPEKVRRFVAQARAALAKRTP